MKISFISTFLLGIIFLTLPALAQVQSHPLSQVTPIDVNLNITGVNITNVSYVFFGNNSNDVAVFRPSANTIALLTNNLERFRIDSSGNLGINTSSPTQTLTVIGTANITGTFSVSTLGSCGTVSTTTNGTLQCGGAVAAAGWGTNGNYIYNATSTASVGINDSTPQSQLEIISGSRIGALNITNGTGTTIFYVNASNQSVGIGTNSPGTAALNVTNGNISIAGTNVGIIYPDGSFQSGVVNSSQLYGYNGTAWVGLNTTGNGVLRLNPQDSINNIWSTSGSYVFISGSSTVGINDSTPQSQLEIISGNRVGALNVTYANGTSIFYVNGSSGAIGIGTSSPGTSAGLNVTNGNISIAGTSTGILWPDNSFQSGVVNTSQLYGYNGTSWVGLNTTNNGVLRLNIQEGVLTNGWVMSGSTLYNNTAGVQVGIGTSTPNAGLNVTNGNISIAGTNTGLIYPDGSFQTTADTNASQLYGYNGSQWVGLNTTNTGILQLTVEQSTTPGWVLSGSNLYNSTSGVNVGIGTSNPAGLFDVNGKLTVLSSSKVGINTTVPNATLEVKGASNANIIVNGSMSTGVTRLYASDSNVVLDTGFQLNSPYGTWLEIGDVTAPTTGLGAYPIILQPIHPTNQNAGYVGIGTNAPHVTLEINSTGNAGSLNITNGTYSTALYVNASAGRVGIGTTSPNAILYIDGLGNAPGGSQLAINGGWLHFYNGTGVKKWGFAPDWATGKLSLYDYTKGGAVTQWTENGDIVFTPTGNIGINKTTPAALLDVQSGIGQGSGNYAAVIGNVNTVDSTTNAVLGLTTGTAATGLSTRYVQFGAGCTPGNLNCLATIGHININNNAVNYGTSGADFGERMHVDENVTYGDIIGSFNGLTVKATQGSSLIGVISDTTGFTGNDKDNLNKSDNPSVGLLGQVKTKVSTENGPIHKGDFITISSISGVGTKAINAGQIIGIAMQDFDGTSCDLILSANGSCVNKISVFVNRGWYDNSNSIEKLQQENAQLKSQLADIQTRLSKLEGSQHGK